MGAAWQAQRGRPRDTPTPRTSAWSPSIKANFEKEPLYIYLRSSFAFSSVSSLEEPFAIQRAKGVMQKYCVPYFLRMVALSSIFERLVTSRSAFSVFFNHNVEASMVH